jgi:hypothetical protein
MAYDRSRIVKGAYIVGGLHRCDIMVLEDGAALVAPRHTPTSTDLDEIERRIRAAQAKLDEIVAAGKTK